MEVTVHQCTEIESVPLTLIANASMDQDQDTQSRISESAVTLCGKSWTAYVGLAIRLLLLVGLGITAIYWQLMYWQFVTLILLVGLTFIGYRLALLRSYRLYYDAGGVWIYSGILPWKRGVAGVKWRDLDEAIFVNNFWSWISGSYTVQLRHRFTKVIEISEASMVRGKHAVIAINQQHRQRIRSEGDTVAVPQ
jgi:hypothetical protein